MRAASRLIDEVNALHGKHRLALGTGLFLPRRPRTDRDESPRRKRALLTGETERRRLGLPRLAIRV
jgi:hypothetical protein